MKIAVIGINDNRKQEFSPKIKKLIDTNSVFSGGKRHYEIVKPYLPENHKWIPITIPLENVYDKYYNFSEIVVFASGDPLFYGFANTLIREMRDADITVYPFFNSLQLLAHRQQIGYQNIHVVSLTGRPWHKFDEALINGHELIGILTDKSKHTPITIAHRMLDYGYDNYSLIVGENLGNEETERITELSLKEVKNHTFSSPNNIILQRISKKVKHFGIPESEFHLLNGRKKMITKMPIRLLSLSMLQLHNKSVFWDIGFCTGSVSIEAKLQFPHLQIVSFEKREEGEELIIQNSKKLGTPGIKYNIGDFTQIDITDYPKPDAVFIGGHGGNMHGIVEKVNKVISNDGILVFNSVSSNSKNLFLDSITQFNFELNQCIQIQIDDFNTIDVMQAIKKDISA